MNYLEAANYEKIVKEIEKLNSKKSFDNNKEDDRFWKPTTDKAGNGYAVIRFLPTPAVDGTKGMPWIKMVSHGFQGPTGDWYIENSLTTLGLADPVAELNNKLWNSGVESDKNLARNQRMKKQFISNIYVVEDPANPENEGKVFLFRYGAKIFTKIEEAMEPPFPDELPINPFNMTTQGVKPGANFHLKIRNVEGYRNYDKSSFGKPCDLSDDPEELDRIHKSEYSLLEFHESKNFKTYEELKRRLDRVLNGPSGPDRASRDMELAKEVEIDDEVPWLNDDDNNESVKETKGKGSSKPKVESDDDKEILEYFKSLAEDD